MVVIDATGTRSLRPFPPERIDPKLCLFEFVYFARPDSRLYGQTVHTARQRMGELLADQAPLPPDDHDPGPGGHGDARARVGHPRGRGLRPAQRHPLRPRPGAATATSAARSSPPARPSAAPDVRVKLNPIRENIAGKRLVVVEDSIVRGTTMRALVAMLREAGAAEVHLRISSPPYRWPCHFGMDTGTRSELLAADLTVPEVRDYLGCDTLAYLELDALLDRHRLAPVGFCTACLTGDYPVEVPGMPTPGRRRRRGAARRRPRRSPSGPTRRPGPRPTPRAGVDIAAGEAAVERIKAQGALHLPARGHQRHRRLRRPVRLRPGRYRNPVLVSSTDSVGTKALVARQAGRLDTIGIDLVAMVVDDIAAQGAEPLFFLDCISVGRLDPDEIEHAGRRRRRRLPPGRVRPGRRRDGRGAGDAGGRARSTWSASASAWSSGPAWSPATGSQPGDRIIGLPSPGLRCNGYSLARRVLFDRAGLTLDGPAWPGADHTLADELLRPSVIYSPALVDAVPAGRRAGPGPHHRRRPARQPAPGPAPTASTP